MGSDTLHSVAGMEQLLLAHRHVRLQHLELHMPGNRSQPFTKSCLGPPVMTSMGLLGRHVPKTDKDPSAQGTEDSNTEVSWLQEAEGESRHRGRSEVQQEQSGK